MSGLKRFELNRWIHQYHHEAKYDLAGSCCDPIAIETLLQWSKEEGEQPPSELDLFKTAQSYAPMGGDPRLRLRIAQSFYSRSSLGTENVLVTHGGITANFAVFLALVRAPSHVVCTFPTYQQLYDVPRSLGADVSLWKARPDTHWRGSMKELEGLLRPSTRLLVLNHPNNPTGQVLSRGEMTQIIDLVRKTSPECYILCDEAHAPILHSADGGQTATTFMDVATDSGFNRAVVTGSFSKSLSLAGIRVGWIATPDLALVEDLTTCLDHTVISCTKLGTELALLALSDKIRTRILTRNVALTRVNADVLRAWCKAQGLEMIPCLGGAISLVHLGDDIDDVDFSQRACQESGTVCMPVSDDEMQG